MKTKVFLINLIMDDRIKMEKNGIGIINYKGAYYIQFLINETYTVSLVLVLLAPWSLFKLLIQIYDVFTIFYSIQASNIPFYLCEKKILL